MPSPRVDERWVVALLIGELSYMTSLNRITTAIVERAVSFWRKRPGAILICECEPMAALARSLGVPAESVRVAIPEPGGHTTRWAAERVRAMDDLGTRPLQLVTHRLHGRRASRMFSALHLRVEVEEVDAPFERSDPDWKLRSSAIFRLYNTGAWVYCYARGWL